MRTLRLYTGVLPNEGDNEYVHFTNKGTYLSYLASQGQFLELIDADNYRIENNLLRLSYSAARMSVTYIVEMDTLELQHWKCYKVRNVSNFSSMCFLQLEVDLWATWYMSARFPLINVKRCNLNLGQGKYDDVESVEYAAAGDAGAQGLAGTAGSGYTNRTFLTLSQVYIVFVANVVVAQSIDQSTLVTTTHTFAALLHDVRAAFSVATQGSVNAVELATKYVSGIYKAGSSFWLDNKVEIVKAYLVPDFVMITLQSLRKLKFTAKTEFDNNADIDVDFYVVEPKRTISQFPITLQTDFDLNYKYYYGTIDGGLECERYTKDYTNFVLGYFDNDGVRVVIRQGDREKDITPNFEVGISGISRASDAGQDIARVGRALTNTLNIALKSSEVKNAAGATRVGIGVLGGAFDTLSKGGVNASPLMGSGDGAATFAVPNNGENRVFNPLYYTYYKSTRNEKAHARVYGAAFDAFVSSLADLRAANYDMLGELTGFNKVFVAAEAQIEGVPIEAQNYIKNALKNGLYLRVLITP